MIEAEQSLMKVITELDNGMRTQFTAKFEEIKVEFDIPDEAKSLGYAPKVKMHLSSEKLNKLGWKAEVDMKEAYLRMMNDMEA